MTLFLLLGSVMGSWAGRIPTVRGQIGLTDAQWGLIILASPVGTFITLMVVARIIPRTGARRLAIPGAVAVLCVVPVTATTDRVWALTLALLAQGMSSALLSTPMNTLAVEVERRYERPIMSSFHACFSLGQLAGGLVGVLAASAGVTPALAIPTTRMANPTDVRNHADVARRRSSGSPSPVAIITGKVPSPKPAMTTAPPSQEPENIA